MTQPSSPSAAALALADWMRSYFLPRGPWAHPDNRLDVAAKLQEFADNAVAFAAQSVAAERAKPAASDLEAARAVISEWLNHDLTSWLDTELAELRKLIAAALAERGERERERAAEIIPQAMRPFWNSAGDGIIDGMLDECEEAIAAAIRNQTLTGD